ncbi:hypothetical protein Acr_00g0066660 [Actinidia rufa]|uniref:Uncharacterized protein n=1 Tax=Actinidia rufa TaxID=165716 RepID=A0A7J0DQD9_9ERIC|nr:hypothetical protein Acr_00g0066660 [Actinidia rufa]
MILKLAKALVRHILSGVGDADYQAYAPGTDEVMVQLPPPRSIDLFGDQNRPCHDSPDRRYGDNRSTVGDIQVIHNGFGSGGCSSSSRKRHTRCANGRAEEEVYNLSSPTAGTHQPITFTNDDLKGLHLSHDDALVISATIANFNVQRIFIDNGSFTDILFISAFDKIKIGRDKLHPFHTSLVGFGGNTTHPLKRIKLQ